MDKHWKHHAKWRNSDLPGHISSGCICEMSTLGKFIETESRLAVCWGLSRGGNGEWLLMAVLDDENVLELELWWSHSLVDVMKTTELYSFKGWILQYVNHINKVKLSAVAWGENQLEMDAFLKIRYDYNMKFKLEGDVERESSVEMLDLQNLPWPCGFFFFFF